MSWIFLSKDSLQEGALTFPWLNREYPAHLILPLSLLFSLDNESNFRLSDFLCLWPSVKGRRGSQFNMRTLVNMLLLWLAPLENLRLISSMTTSLKWAWQTSHNVSRQSCWGLFGQTVCLQVHYVVLGRHFNWKRNTYIHKNKISMFPWQNDLNKQTNKT